MNAIHILVVCSILKYSIIAKKFFVERDEFLSLLKPKREKPHGFIRLPKAKNVSCKCLLGKLFRKIEEQPAPFYGFDNGSRFVVFKKPKVIKRCKIKILSIILAKNVVKPLAVPAGYFVASKFFQRGVI